MRYPLKPRAALKQVSLPRFSGGVDTRGNDIDDSALKESLNMWYYNGTLRTRPAFCRYVNSADLSGDFKLRVHRDIMREQRVLISASGINNQNFEVHFFLQGERDAKALPKISLPSESAVDFFLCEDKSNLYCFFENAVIYRLPIGHDSGWSRVAESEMHAPLMYIGGVPDASGNIKNSVQFESRNLLSRYYKFRFSAANPESEESPLLWKFPHSLPADFKGVITAEYTDISGTVSTHTVVLKGEADIYFEGGNSSGLFLFVKRDGRFGLSAEFESENAHTLSREDYRADNLTVTAIADFEDKSENVFKNKLVSLFCGTEANLKGASRLFLAGNPESAATVIYSGIDNPLYFPENCYFNVGNTAHKITALKCLADRLIIFKQSEIYSVTHKSDYSLTAEDILLAGNADVSALSAFFPLKSIESHIGCDCADTAVLCGNSLFFAYNRNIYRLCGKEVTCVSKGVEALLSAEDFASAKAMEFCGHYVLCSGRNLYALNHQSREFPIYPWRLAYSPEEIFSVGGRLAVLERGQGYGCLVSDMDSGDDLCGGQAVPIESFITTKNYAFGSASRKIIHSINLMVGCTHPIRLSLISAAGEKVADIYPTGNRADETTGQVIMRPASLTERITLCMESVGAWQLENINILYKSSGGVF